jgi:hypothetical protein
MKTFLITFLMVCVFQHNCAQDSSKHIDNKVTIGIEQDVLPYVLGGYFVSGWTGRDKMRCRFSHARANTPKFIHGDDIKAEAVNAFGISLEYFFIEN